MTSNMLVSRRKFIKSLALGTGAALLPFSSAFSASSTELDMPFEFRRNAPLLPLHFNENSLGMSEKAVVAAKQAINRYGNRYPDVLVNALKETLADTHSVAASQLVLGNGSTEVLGAVVAFASSLNATLIEPSPTFGDVRGRATARGMKIIQIELADDFQTNLSALKEQADKIKTPVLINICNPNNPTGTIVNHKQLTKWIANAPDNQLFLIDEAYHEYAVKNPLYQSVLPLIQAGKENLVLTRTFSKIYGMAGMRVGYGIAAKDTAQRLNKLATSWNLSAPGVAAAQASLEDSAFFQRSLASNSQAKSILINALNDLQLEYIPSNTNFVLHKINTDLESYSSRMLMNKVKVGRRMTKQDGYNRISIGQPHEMEAFVKVLKAFRTNAWV